MELLKPEDKAIYQLANVLLTFIITQLRIAAKGMGRSHGHKQLSRTRVFVTPSICRLFYSSGGFTSVISQVSVLKLF